VGGVARQFGRVRSKARPLAACHWSPAIGSALGLAELRSPRSYMRRNADHLSGAGERSTIIGRLCSIAERWPHAEERSTTGRVWNRGDDRLRAACHSRRARAE
jgi:hypothetical protein